MFTIFRRTFGKSKPCARDGVSLAKTGNPPSEDVDRAPRRRTKAPGNGNAQLLD